MNNRKLLLKNNKGSALVMVVAVVLILVSFGTITMLAGLSNTEMGARYRNWSQEYYEVDKRTEYYISAVDSILNNAEDTARKYFSNEDFKKTVLTPDLPEIQSYIYNEWKSIWDSCYTEFDSTASQQTEYFDQAKYDGLLKTFVENGFKKLYFYYAIKQLSNPVIAKQDSKDSFLLTGSNIDFTQWLTLQVSTINPSFQIKSYFKDSSNLDTYKMVDAILNIKLPEYTAITQSRKVPFRVNPIWTNAISATGNIYFNDTSSTIDNQVTINGDLFSADKDVSTDYNVALDESYDNGIVSHGAVVTVNGNIYSRGDVHVAGKVKNGSGADVTYTRPDGNSGRITVNNYKTGMPVTYKKSAFGKQNLYLELKGDSDISKEKIDELINKFTKGNSASSGVPFFYPDSNGGNVYCNTLSVESECNAANITVNGNVTTKDDVQMDGNSSQISISGNYIGITNIADDHGNYNASSSILNNTPNTSSISINGSLIIPGQAYLALDNAPFFYSTGISLGSLGTNGTIFNAFTDNTSGSTTDFHTYTINKRNFTLFDDIDNPDQTANNTQKIIRIINYLQGKTFDTNIALRKVEGYALGSVISRDSSSGNNSKVFYGTSTNPVINNSLNQFNFYEQANEGKQLLLRVFKAKTNGLGLDSKSITGNFGNFIDRNSARLSTLRSQNIIISGPTLNLADGTKTYGIVYADGDLKITGNGEFYGTIICEGNVSIDNHPTITFSEDVIVNLINTYDELKAFFTPGQSGNDVFYSKVAVNSGTATVRKRYSITQWKESQVRDIQNNAQ